MSFQFTGPLTPASLTAAALASASERAVPEIGLSAVFGPDAFRKSALGISDGWQALASCDSFGYGVFLKQQMKKP